MALSVDRVNTKAAKMTIFGWLAGLAWFAYDNGIDALSIISWAILIVVGMFASSIVIGGGIMFLMAGLTKLVTGDSEGSIHFFAWGAFISPVIAFFCASPLAQLFA